MPSVKSNDIYYKHTNAIILFVIHFKHVAMLPSY
jgi:hypothetical protein